MIVDLKNLPVTVVLDVVNYCCENNIDVTKCISILEAWYDVPVPDINWELDIPEEHIIWLLLKLV